MRLIKIITLAGIASLVAMPALATNAGSVKSMTSGAPVTLNGTVENFNSEHSFTLRDASGAVDVSLAATKSVVLKDGEKVSVTGTISKGLLGTEVTANNVSEDKGVGQQVGEALDSVTGQDQASKAQQVNIQSLPNSGLVKIDGTVASVDSEKKFSLKDSTGKVGVTITSAQSASLSEGTPVTVVGYVDKGLLGKSINATEVQIRK